jgi:MSHA biogenesis protein MshO
MMKNRGFTLVELVIVIVITGILAATLTVFLKPTIDSYFDTRRRADLTDMADTALRRMSQDIRRAVPNSIRWVSAGCFQLVPTIAGGRYRMESDTVSATASKWVDSAALTTDFDVLSPMASIPVAGAANGDWVVIDNQNGDEVYTDPSPGPRARITAFSTASTAAQKLVYQHRITVSKQFPPGYDGGRFVIVPNAEQTVFYNRVGTTLYRTVDVFGAVQATSCAKTTGAVVATNVQNFTVVYSSNQGATQQSGFVWMRLELGDPLESVALAYGVHVDNVP